MEQKLWARTGCDVKTTYMDCWKDHLDDGIFLDECRHFVDEFSDFGIYHHLRLDIPPPEVGYTTT